jgi:gamma-glutamyltranspeptidase
LDRLGVLGLPHPRPGHLRQRRGPPTAGDRLVQDDLADSLRLVAEEGAGAVYSGELGRAMVSEVQRNGGFLSAGTWMPTAPPGGRP